MTEPAPRRALGIVFLVVFIDLLGFGLILPLLPRYGDKYYDGLIALGFPTQARGLIVGLMYSSFSLMQFVFSPLWGRLSDRIGRRPVLLVGLSGSVLFYALFGYASGLPAEWAATAMTLLVLARVGAGIAGATIATAQAVIADTTSPEQRSRGMALIGAAFGIGFTFGPLLGAGTLALWPERLDLPGYAASALSLLALSVGLVLLPETRQPQTPGPRRGWLNPRGLGEVLATPTVGGLVLTFFLATFAFANFEGTLSLLTLRAFGFSDRQNFLVFAFVGFTLMIAQGLVYRRLALSVSEATFIRLGLALMFLGLTALGVVAHTAEAPTADRTWLTVFVAALIVSVFGFAFLTPSVQALISKRSDPTRQGEVLGVNQSAAALARILGPFLGMTLFEIGLTRAWPYGVAAGLLAALLIAHRRSNGTAPCP